MAAIFAPPTATTSDPSTRSSVALVSGLVAFFIGFFALVAGAVLPNPRSHPGAVLAAAANRVAPGPIAGRQDSAWVTGDAVLSSASSANGSSELIAMDDHLPSEHHPLRPSADGQKHAVSASRWEGEIHADIDRARRTGAGSADSATMSLSHDLRVELAAMAAEQHRWPVLK